MLSSDRIHQPWNIPRVIDVSFSNQPLPNPPSPSSLKAHIGIITHPHSVSRPICIAEPSRSTHETFSILTSPCLLPCHRKPKAIDWRATLPIHTIYPIHLSSSLCTDDARASPVCFIVIIITTIIDTHLAQSESNRTDRQAGRVYNQFHSITYIYGGAFEVGWKWGIEEGGRTESRHAILLLPSQASQNCRRIVCIEITLTCAMIEQPDDRNANQATNKTCLIRNTIQSVNEATRRTIHKVIRASTIDRKRPSLPDIISYTYTYTCWVMWG
ncbi:hypothetical protein J3F83DRAFT_735081 [Trichoderma novae-zelandiae]